MTASSAQRLASVVFLAGAVLAAPGGTAAQPSPVPRRPIELRTIKDMSVAMQVCWLASQPAMAVPGMTVRVMVTFNRSGEVFGEPRFTYVTRGVPTDTLATFQRAAASAIARCNPLPVSDGLGRSIAGRPFIFQFVDRRTEKGA